MMKKAKKVNNKKINSMISTDNEMSKLIILILVVAFIFAVFYIITLFVTKNDDNKNDDSKEQSTEATIQYDLAGNIFSQKDDEYYVLAYFKNDKYVDYYKSYLAYYKDKVENAVSYYFVDMDDVFNNDFIAEKSNLNVSDVKKLKFSQTALLRISDGKIVSSYEGNENITGKLGRMTK